MSLFYFSCKKETSTSSSGYTSLEETYSKFSPTFQSFAIDASFGGDIKCANGTRITFPPNAFINAQGVAQSGTVAVSVKEIFDRVSMIYTGIMPISNGDPLVSGGEVGIFVNNIQGELFLAPGKNIDIRIPQKGIVDPLMTAFGGGRDMDSVKMWNGIDSIHGFTLVQGNDTIHIGRDSLGWSNADRFLSNPNYVTFRCNRQNSWSFWDVMFKWTK